MSAEDDFEEEEERIISLGQPRAISNWTLFVALNEVKSKQNSLKQTFTEVILPTQERHTEELRSLRKIFGTALTMLGGSIAAIVWLVVNRPGGL